MERRMESKRSKDEGYNWERIKALWSQETATSPDETKNSRIGGKWGAERRREGRQRRLNGGDRSEEAGVRGMAERRGRR